MRIDPVNPHRKLELPLAPAKHEKQAKQEEQAKTSQINKQQPAMLTNTEDTFVRSKNEADIQTYKPDLATIQKLKAQTDHNYQQLRELVRQLLERQGHAMQDLKINHDMLIKIDETARAEAQAMIGEGGPLSAEAVSDRIVDFAIALSGGDKSKAEELRSAIDQGFKEAARILGGDLPEISVQTQTMIHEKLDAWLAN